MMQVVWVTLLPASLDQGGGAVYSQGLQSYFKAREGFCYKFYHVLPKSAFLRRCKLFFALLFGALPGLSSKIVYCFSILTLLRVAVSRADCLVCDHVETGYLAKVFRGRTILVLHNVEGDLMAQRASLHKGVRAWYLEREAMKLSRFEQLFISGADQVVSLAEEDIAKFRSLGIRADIDHIPPKFNYNSVVRYVSRPISKIGFLGNLEWWPNAEGLEWYLRHVHHLHECELSIFGRGVEKVAVQTERLKVRGYVEDINEVWASMDLMIAPIISGSGVSIKTAESLYNGLPVLATPAGARGLMHIGDAGGLYVRGAADAWGQFIRQASIGGGLRGVPDEVRVQFSAAQTAPVSRKTGFDFD